MFESLDKECDLCKADIRVGDKYGVFVFNIERIEQNAQYPHGIVTVESSDEVNVMCLRCASKFDNSNVKKLLD